MLQTDVNYNRFLDKQQIHTDVDLVQFHLMTFPFGQNVLPRCLNMQGCHSTLQ